MSQRNNIVSLLMDKVPRKNREGYVANQHLPGHFIICELPLYQTMREFLESHTVFGNCGENNRDLNMEVLCQAAVEHQIPGRWSGLLLLKIRLNNRSDGGFYTTLAGLGTRLATAWTVVDQDNQVYPQYIGNRPSAHMPWEQMIAIMEDAPVVNSTVPDDLNYDDYEHEVHGIFIE